MNLSDISSAFEIFSASAERRFEFSSFVGKTLILSVVGFSLVASGATSWLQVGDNLGGGGSGSKQTLSEVLSQGNDMSGSEIVDTTGPITFGGGTVEIPDGGLDISSPSNTGNALD